jgi:hypothetical protein
VQAFLSFLLQHSQEETSQRQEDSQPSKQDCSAQGLAGCNTVDEIEDTSERSDERNVEYQPKHQTTPLWFYSKRECLESKHILQ